ncbi:Crp/Fnr family transcriptional regulator [Tabrizicola sp. J26]|uniref:Crp/Fnr family transcriptional regulator n=1 Tax=Alitabrizicola rongguiensis TaxID=2909234 RepID=UPI001F1CD257|nr:Crp/Fnr family transcriptional regulator [Tabrizicola rongguiensis]MCF1710615.1 Crp/Fnr family transcriptional regulator [Tabrizicola rongguiensis]
MTGTQTKTLATRPGHAFWRSFPMFENLGDETLAALSEVAVAREWPAGAVLFLRGEPGDYLLAIAEGRVKLSLVTPGGRELALAIAEPGTIIGEMVLFDEDPRSADGTALTATCGYVVDRAAFRSVAERHSDLMEGVARFLCRRLRDTNDKLESIALYGLDARLARFLLFTLRQIHGDDLPDKARLRLAITQSDLAAVLGASRPKVNRALQALIEDQAIQREGEVLICDPARLRELADPDIE